MHLPQFIDRLSRSSKLREVTEAQGLPQLAIPQLHAATMGLLDVARLVAMDPTEAMADRQGPPRIGPFYSALVVARACGLSDVLPLNEPRGRASIERLHGLPPVSDEEFTQLAEPWRPYRTWALFLARAAGARLTGA